ncbi:MAG: hypothetical protein P0Y53_01115 [Candidatus Pseudobacter hemicellulosilyticus]|uniref:von Willebrand factor type A domain-containing protein n=1 Tax=Candidatus Pseudobacter hemicellulosilyticus TaxID=3121375 RepID=A0AAJ5WSX5_9BACT|nr:MAG: hypothetical protein P0Y53_01115 [Pseudobacter sp.]
MNRLFLLTTACLLVTGAIATVMIRQQPVTEDRSTSGSIASPAAIDAQDKGQQTPATTVKEHTGAAASKIQVAVLLDVSNSMDGLIEQAKAQLWNMVNVLGKATCDNMAPTVEIALYEYGRPANGSKNGYIKRINGFTRNLDQLSENLFRLTTNGGDEYCSQVIYTSLTELEWDPSSSNYKVIFIAGNEDFHQGSVSFTRACAEAGKKGVIVNTIYCGDRSEGIREHWNLGTECGKGSFTNINQNEKIEDIATPYDDQLFALNEKLNGTYISYGETGAANYEQQRDVDKMNYSNNRSAAAKRVSVKSKSVLYENSQWDLIDANTKDSTIIAKVDTKTLPADLQSKSRAELKTIVTTKSKERTQLQKDIASLSVKREGYITAEKNKTAAGKEQRTLESEIEKIIREQAKRFNMLIK